MIERRFEGGEGGDDEHKSLPTSSHGENQRPGDDCCGKCEKLTPEQLEWLAGIEVPFGVCEYDFFQNDARVNDFVRGVVKGAYAPNGKDDDGNTLDDCMMRAAEAISGATTVLLESEPGIEQDEIELAAHTIIRRWLADADQERSALFYGMADDDVFFPLYDEDTLSADLVDALTVDGQHRIGDAASAVATLYFKISAEKIAVLWEWLEKGTGEEEMRGISETLGEIKVVLDRIARPDAILKKIGSHLVDVAKLAAGVSAGVVIGSLVSKNLRSQKGK